MIFFCLQWPRPDSTRHVYGQPEWYDEFESAEWNDRVVGISTGRFKPPFGRPVTDLSISLPSRVIGDFVWTCYSDCIVTDDVLSLFRNAGFTGFDARRVDIERIVGVSRKRMREEPLPPLWELLILGEGGDADPASGIRVIGHDEATGNPIYSSFRNGIIVDEDNWDGSDFFRINGYYRYYLVTERVSRLIIERQLVNCMLIPSHKLEWGSDFRNEDLEARRREFAARSLESLLSELDSEDTRDWLAVLFALGEKGEAGALDAIIKKFAHPDPIYWTSAAGAAAAIYLHKDTSEHTRHALFTRLRDLLNHDNYIVRKSAATTFLRIGGERAAKEVLILLEDEHEAVRSTAIFVMEQLHYKPALEAIKRLIKDPSKRVRVRVRAREAYREMSADLP
jgi:hypothetical protein